MEKILVVYSRLYLGCVRAAFKGIAKNAWTLLLPIGLAFAFSLIAPVLGNLGLVGGFLLAMVLDALYSCYLYFTGEVVASSRVSLKEFRTSIGAYFWSVMNLMFVLWIVGYVLGLVEKSTPNGGVIATGVWLVMAILLNPSPEIIYQRGTRNGLETIQSCVTFIQEQWIEWYLPNILLGVAAFVFVTIVLVLLPGILYWLGILVGGAVFHFVMVFRGHLFKALDGSSHRQRMFKYRNAA